MSFSRRDLLKLGSLAAVSGLYGQAAIAGPHKPKKTRCKNIIFCVSDGMPMSAPTIANHYSERILGKSSYWTWLMKQDYVVNGLQDTPSLSSVVTDSSAASSAWGSGRRIWNAQVNMYPDGTKLRPIANIVKDAGMKVGLVTTSRITHATPAGFAAVCESRGMESLIAQQYLSEEIDVLLGGGDDHFNPLKRTDKLDLYAKYRAAGYKIAKSRSELMDLKASKLLGVFSRSHIPFSVDRNQDSTLKSKVPTLAEMTKVAINNLKSSKNGFLLQIEGARIDHAAHANDFAGAIFDQIAFEDAVKVAIEFAQQDGETLVVVTADHACGGLALNGSGDEYIDSNDMFNVLHKMRASYDVLSDALGKTPSMSHIGDVIESKLSVKLKRDEIELIYNGIKTPKPIGTSEFKTGLNSALGIVLGNYSKVGWTSHNHTSEYVLVTAFGPGKEQFAGVTRNTQFFDAMLAMKGLKYSNPKQMSFETAASHRAKKRTEPESHHALHSCEDEDC